MRRWFNFLLLIIWCTGLVFPVIQVHDHGTTAAYHHLRGETSAYNLKGIGDLRYHNKAWPPTGDFVSVGMGLPVRAIELDYCRHDGALRTRINFPGFFLNSITCSCCTALLLALLWYLERKQTAHPPTRGQADGMADDS